MKQFLLILTCIVIIQGMCLAGPVVSLLESNIECLENGPDKKKKQTSEATEEDSEDLEQDEDDFEEIQEEEDSWEEDADEEVKDDSMED